MYGQCFKIEPDNYEVLNDWAQTMMAQAMAIKNTHSLRLMEWACGRLEELLRFDPGRCDAWYNWGVALQYLGRNDRSDLAYGHYEQASEKYAEAVSLDPGMLEGWSNWGIVLAEMGKRSEDGAREKLLEEALARFAKAEEIAPGAAAENIARVRDMQ